MSGLRYVCLMALGLAAACTTDVVGSSSEGLTLQPLPIRFFTGEPLPPPNNPQLGQITVEGVGGLVTHVTSRFDNPELRTLINVPVVSGPEGGGLTLDSSVPTLTMSNTVVPGGITIFAGDLQMYASGAGTTGVDAMGIPLQQHAGAVAAPMIVWPEQTTTFFGGDTADLYARGVRLGYTPLTIQTHATNPDFTLGPSLSSVTISLDPNVVLVPVQVFVIQSATFPSYSGLGNVQGNLELWDQVPSVVTAQEYVTGGVGGLLASTNHMFSSWFGTPAWGPVDVGPTWEFQPFDGYQPLGKLIPCSECDSTPDNSNYYTPDSIFRDCEVQFRMVKFDTLFITDADCALASSPDTSPHCADRLVNNPSLSVGETCQILNKLVVQNKLGGVDATLPTLIVTNELANGTGLADTTVLGGPGPVSCVAKAANLALHGSGNDEKMVVAHEVYHWSGNFDCGDPAGDCEIGSMNSATAPPSDLECRAMHTWATSNWLHFFEKPCPPFICERPPPIRGL